MEIRTLLWQAITPLHVGTGQVSASVIDLPVAREAATGWPIIPASAIKGVYRDGEGLRSDQDETAASVVTARRRFGFTDRTTENGKTESGVGTLTFTDARLFALAVPSYKGTYALVTSPLVVRRLNRERTALGLKLLPELEYDLVTEAVVAHRRTLVATVDQASKLVLQDFVIDLGPEELQQEVAKLADAMTERLSSEDAKAVRERLCLVPDDVFDFLCTTALEVTPHVRLDPDRKSVKDGALWWEECIPAGSLLTSLVFSSDEGSLDAITERTWLQIGGKSSVGRGLVSIGVSTPSSALAEAGA